MPRIPSGETEGGIYHIINRGNIKMQVFDDMEDYDYFLELLEKASQRENVEIHAFRKLITMAYLKRVLKVTSCLLRFYGTFYHTFI